jgi:hypothetical protein
VPGRRSVRKDANVASVATVTYAPLDGGIEIQSPARYA